ncbi:hypothetical protein [Streptomyces sp. NPDC046821]|uniref:hypothetical protein n=1 Tax=Streptomyces sp. NPDC046821 TaxID=3154702 RepID=UPI0033C13282
MSTNPYTPPPAPRPPDNRPLHKRKRIWLGGAGLLLVGALATGGGNTAQQPAAAEAKPAPTVTVTTTPEPGPTVTETLKPEPRPTITVTETVKATKTVDSGSGSTGGGGGQAAGGTCSIRSNSGNCYDAGQFCRNSDHEAVTTTEDGARIKCTLRSNRWRWTYA